MPAAESPEPGTDLLSLSADLDELSVETGAELIAQGTSSQPNYVLVEGTVVVERDGVAFATVDGALESLLQRQAPAVRPGSARDPEG